MNRSKLNMRKININAYIAGLMCVCCMYLLMHGLLCQVPPETSASEHYIYQHGARDRIGNDTEACRNISEKEKFLRCMYSYGPPMSTAEPDTGDYNIHTHARSVFFEPPKFFISGKDLCSNNPTTVIVVQSSPDNYVRRDAIRQTWGAVGAPGGGAGGVSSLSRDNINNDGAMQQQPQQDVAVVFLYGIETTVDTSILKTEVYQFRDVVVANFSESYRNLVTKTLITLHWVNSFCPSAKYLVKCDDDTAINIPNLIDYVTSVPVTSGVAGAILTSTFGYNRLVRRTGKWGVSELDFPNSRYPPYLHGPAYVITTDVIPRMLRQTAYTPLIPIEDVYVTGVLPYVLDLKLYGSSRFPYTSSPPVDGQSFHDVIATTNLKPNRLREMWNSYIALC